MIPTEADLFGDAVAPNFRNRQTGYSSLTISLHWLMLLLMIATYAMMELKTIYPKGSPGRDNMAFWHFSLGLLIFCFVWVRLWTRSTGTAPVVQPAMPTLQMRTAKVMQFALYVLMIGLPLLGWLTLSAKGKPIPFFGTELPALMDKDQDTAKLLKQLHTTLANAGYFLIGLHAAAALFHHYVKRDNTLRLMLPPEGSKRT
jgi:cytochrome b561